MRPARLLERRGNVSVSGKFIGDDSARAREAVGVVCRGRESDRWPVACLRFDDLGCGRFRVSKFQPMKLHAVQLRGSRYRGCQSDSAHD